MTILSDGPGSIGHAGSGWHMPPTTERPPVAAGYAEHDGRQAARSGAGRGTRFVALTRLAGAAASLALMIGVGIWGYRLLVRDVNGIPVVRAMEGPMRVAPENPGGEVTDYAGLAVNAIAAMGEAAPPEDVLTLAPAAEELAPEDMAHAAPSTAEEITAPLTAEEVLAFADEIAAGTTPLAPLADGQEVAAADTTAPADETSSVTVIPADTPGVAVSLRPRARAAERVAIASATQAEAADTSAPEEVLSGPLPEGTVLVQFGAYETPALAAEQWSSLAARYTSFLDAHERVIQEAASGGREFYRLRAIGFADMGEARRLCTALIAEGVDCIPTIEG